MMAPRVLALVTISRPRLVLLDLLLFLTPLPVLLRGGVDPTHGNFALGLVVFFIGRTSVMLLDAYYDAEADAAAGMAQFAALNYFGPNAARHLAYSGFGACLILSPFVGKGFLLVMIAGGLLAVAQFALPRLRPETLAPFFIAPLLVSLQLLLGWIVLAPLDEVAALLFLAVFAWDLSHDCVGAIRDIDGDRVAGIQTPALRYGLRATAAAAIGCLALSYLFLALGSLWAGIAWFAPLGLPVLIIAWRRLRRSLPGAGSMEASFVRRQLESYLMVSVIVLAGCSLWT